MRRRSFHQAALALALAAMGKSQAQPAANAPRWQSNPFALGVASGMPRPDSVVLWTRLATGLNGLEGLFDAKTPGSPHPAFIVRYEIYSNEALRQPVRTGELLASPERGHSVHVLANGLQPARPYWYRFSCGNATSPVGRTRTAPAATATPQRLRIALASCQHFEQGLYAAHGEIATQELDFVLFVGDYIYESTRGGNTSRKPLRLHIGEVPQTLAQYRLRHAQYKTDTQLQAAHAAHPWVLMWDDHEVVNDYANDRDQRYTDPDGLFKAPRRRLPGLPGAHAPAAARNGQRRLGQPRRLSKPAPVRPVCLGPAGRAVDAGLPPVPQPPCLPRPLPRRRPHRAGL